MKEKVKICKSDFLVIGSGAGAYGVVSELVKKNCTVIVAEKGREETDYGTDIIKRANAIYRPGGVFPETDDGIPYYRYIGGGGSVEISCANAVLPTERDLDILGIDIETELSEVCTEMNVRDMPSSMTGENSSLLAASASECGFEMKAMPKFIDFAKCTGCALCELICPHGAKWSPKKLIDDFGRNENTTVMYEVEITKIGSDDGRRFHACGVDLATGDGVRFEPGYIIIAAGGIGTPMILENSGFNTGSGFFMDIYVNVYGRSANFTAKRDIPMPVFYSDPDEEYILSPYLDIELWYGLSKFSMSKWFNGEFYYGLMVKIHDDSNGRVCADGRIKKGVSYDDRKKLDRGTEAAGKILLHAGVDAASIIVTGPRGAHPGGTVAVGKVTDKMLMLNGTENVFIADAGVFSASPGKPPIVTIMSLGKKLGKMF